MNLGTDTFHDPLASNDVGTKPELRAFLPGTDKSKPAGSDSTNRGNCPRDESGSHRRQSCDH